MDSLTWITNTSNACTYALMNNVDVESVDFHCASFTGGLRITHQLVRESLRRQLRDVYLCDGCGHWTKNGDPCDAPQID